MSINVGNKLNVEVLELNESSKKAIQSHEESLRKLEIKTKAKSVVVPTAIDDVKSTLRSLGHPITLFGEGHYDRRERLREIMAEKELNLGDVEKLTNNVKNEAKAVSKSKKEEVFYTVAPEALINARKLIADSSYQLAQERLQKTKHIRSDKDASNAETEAVGRLYQNCAKISLAGSQIGDDRPLTSVRYSKSSNIFASVSLNTNIKIWDIENNLANKYTLRGHEERVTSVAWHPQAYFPDANGSNHRSNNFDGIFLASTSADKTCMLWDCRPNASLMDVDGAVVDSLAVDKNYSRKAVFSGHKGSVTDCAFHPNGRYLGTSSCDYTWRLWDIETRSELLLQDGHINECNAIAFHHDGSLVATCDYAGVILLWDLRSGQQIHFFQGHLKKISCLDFNSNGFQLVSGGVDNTIRVWDLRKKKLFYTIPGHVNSISDVKYSSDGEVIVSSSLDGTVKVWGSRDYRNLKTCRGHSGRVMACDVMSQGGSINIVSCGYDRTVKLWNM